MGRCEFIYRAPLPVPPHEAFAWHARPGAFERLNPPWDPVQVCEPSGGLAPGARLTLRVRVAGPIRVRWIAEHREVEPGRGWCDAQVRGPFAWWEHAHRFEPDGRGGCVLEDRIEYALRGGALAHALGGGFVKRRVRRLFAYRHRVLVGDLAATARWARPPLRILIAGASGLIGTALTAYLSAAGHTVGRLVRGGAAARPTDGIVWDPDAGTLDGAALAAWRPDAVIHLGGESIASGRWTRARKERLRASRVRSTELLSRALAALPERPRVLLAASAVGYYGDRGEEPVDEASPPGQGFLAELACAWEAAAEPARAAGIRVVHLRLGMVLTPAGGGLAKMLPAWRLGLGGPVGSGRQFVPWIALDDVLDAVAQGLMDEALEGPVNLVAPGEVRQREFARALGRVLRRPAMLPLPGWAARAALGEMAGPLLLEGARVQPRRLRERGFRFRYPDLDGALAHVLGLPDAPLPGAASEG